MGMFDDIESVEIRQKGQFITPGKYVFEVKALKAFTGQNGDTFVAELQVLESQKTKADIEPNAKDTGASWVRTFETPQKKKLSHAAIAEFVLAILGHDPGNTKAQDMIKPKLKQVLQAATGEENIFAGKRVKAEAFHTDTKAGGKFTILRWIPISDDVATAVA